MYSLSLPAACTRSKRRTAMFSPIFCTSFWRTASTVSPPILRLASAPTSAGFSSATSLANACANAVKSGLRATKSVSAFTSTIAPSFESGDR